MSLMYTDPMKSGVFREHGMNPEFAHHRQMGRMKRYSWESIQIKGIWFVFLFHLRLHYENVWNPLRWADRLISCVMSFKTPNYFALIGLKILEFFPSMLCETISTIFYSCVLLIQTAMKKSDRIEFNAKVSYSPSSEVGAILWCGKIREQKQRWIYILLAFSVCVCIERSQLNVVCSL